MVAWITRAPNPSELERFRLLLSLVRDPIFARKFRGDTAYPDTEFHEEVHPVAFGGIPVRAKDIFDVLVPVTEIGNQHYGIQLKMRGEWKSESRLYLEWSNAASRDRAACSEVGITADQLLAHSADASAAGQAILAKIHADHDAAETRHKRLPDGHRIRISESKTVHMTWEVDEEGFRYWLHSFPHDLPQIRIWDYTPGENSKSIRGYESEIHRQNLDYCMDWFFTAGSQLKWYPTIASAEYSFGPYRLESIPDENLIGSFENAARRAFVEMWGSTEHQE